MSSRVLAIACRCAAVGLLTFVLATPPAVAQTMPAKSKVFVLIEYQVLDQPSFAKVRDQVRDTLKTHKGDVVAREKVNPIFGGNNPTNLSIVSFASVQDARAWLASKELAALAAQRDKAAKVTTYLVEQID